MRVSPFRTALVAATALLSHAARAEEQNRSLESPRALGRGNTFVAVNDSDEATRQNPATLSETKLRFQVRWLQLDAMVGENTVNTITDLANFDAEANAVSMLETAADKFGKRQFGRVQISPVGVRILWFELSPVAGSTNFLDFRVPTTPEITFASDSYMGMNLAFAMPIGKELNVGLNLRPLYHTVYSGTLQFADVIDFIDKKDLELSDLVDKREGTQLGGDVGAIWRPGKQWRFGLVVENIGYAGEVGTFKAPPQPTPMRVDVGMSYRYDFKPWAWDLNLDVQDLINPEEYHLLRLLHLGTEFGRSYVSRDLDLGLLAGVNEGYFTSGFYADLFILRLNVSYYAVELGEYPGQRKDRRFAATLMTTTTF